MVKKCEKCGKEFCTHKNYQRFCSKGCGISWRHSVKPFGPFQKGNKYNLGSKRSEDSRNRIKMEGNSGWKGVCASKKSVHDWVNNNFGKLSGCEFCGKKYTAERTRSFDWSSKEHNYTSRDRVDWQFLCRSCHLEYDYKMGFRNSIKGTHRK